MGDFQRTRSKVWWSNFAESEDEVVSRVSSSSPSSSHKSQDSGFSDSEHHASPPSAPAPAPNPSNECSCQPDEESFREKRVDVTPPSQDANAPPSRLSASSSTETPSSSPGNPPAENKCLVPRDLQSPARRLVRGKFANVNNEQRSPKYDPSRGHQPLCKSEEVEELTAKKFTNLKTANHSFDGEERQLSTSQDKHNESASRPFLCLDFTGPLEPPTHTSTPKSVANPHHYQRPVRQVNLFKSLSQCREGHVEPGNPVRVWLREIGESYDPECMTTLQSKSIAVDLGRQVAKMAAETIDTVRELQDKTKLISLEFSKLIQQLEYQQLEHVAPLVQSLVGNIVEFIYDYGDKQKTEGNKELVQACDKLRRTAIEIPVNVDDVSSAVTALGHSFTRVVDGVLTKQIQGLVNVLEGPSTEMAVRSALASLTTLGLDGGHLSRLVADSGGIQALLTICLESTASSIRTASLRALATVCSMADTIRQLEQAGGLEILTEILAEESRPAPEISEAAAVLAQITAPWVEDNHNIHGLEEHLPSLIQSLTNLVSKTESDETLLLSAAALANLTFLESRTVWPLLEHGSAGHLLTALRHRGPLASVFLQEQAATLLANMAAVPESRPHLAQQRAVVALLCFLQIRHSPLQCAKQIAAAERVQQKSAIALSRLCSDPGVASEVVQLQGVPRLIRLCKDERERNHSDGVLVACLAALRKIAANCGTKAIEDLDAMELVEPRLLDSFLIYSSRQESYV